MLDLKLLALFPYHLVIQVGAIVRDNLPRKTISVDDFPFNEPDHHTLGDTSVRHDFDPLSEVIDRH